MQIKQKKMGILEHFLKISKLWVRIGIRIRFRYKIRYRFRKIASSVLLKLFSNTELTCGVIS